MGLSPSLRAASGGNGRDLRDPTVSTTLAAWGRHGCGTWVLAEDRPAVLKGLIAGPGGASVDVALGSGRRVVKAVGKHSSLPGRRRDSVGAARLRALAVPRRALDTFNQNPVFNRPDGGPLALGTDALKLAVASQLFVELDEALRRETHVSVMHIRPRRPDWEPWSAYYISDPTWGSVIAILMGVRRGVCGGRGLAMLSNIPCSFGHDRTGGGHWKVWKQDIN
jgi:hypothetical protein